MPRRVTWQDTGVMHRLGHGLCYAIAFSAEAAKLASETAIKEAGMLGPWPVLCSAEAAKLAAETALKEKQA